LAVTSDVIKTIGRRANLPGFRVRSYLKAITDIVGKELAEGRAVELEGFGKFKLVKLPQRQAKANIGSGEKTITLPEAILTEFAADKKIFERKSPSAPAKEEISRIHTRKLNIELAELGDKKIPKTVLSIIPETIARKVQAVPFDLAGKTLSVAMTDPENENSLNLLRKAASGKIIKPYLTTQDDLRHGFEQYANLQAELKELVESENLETVDEEAEKPAEDEISETSPASKIIGSLLKRAVREKASDIHIEPSEEDVNIRFRIDGILRKVLTLPKKIQPALISRVKILSNLKIDETRLPQDGRIQIVMDGNRVDFRISTLPTVTGEKVVARVLDHSKGVLSFDEIGLTGRQYRAMDDNTKKSHGMTLVTGPTGSGKSTTLYAIVSKIKDESINIITMEDPVEYRMPGVTQSQVNAKIEFTFATGLRSILRQDPDVVMVGEIRDRETADIAVNAALTGHIVLSSLHTNDAAGAIPRLLDMGIESFLVTSSLNAVVAQRLCRKICDKCAEEITLESEILRLVNESIEELPEPERTETKKNIKFTRGKGCPACNNTGYKGRIGIYEVMIMSEPMKQLTLKQANSSDILALAKKEGLITMKQDGILKAIAGQTTIEEVWRVTKD